MKEIPVYLFTGFLESGKTKFIQETLCDKRFNNGERTLLIVCEEGEEEYAPDMFSGKNVFVANIESEDELTDQKLAALAKQHKVERAVVEYNGMWTLDKLYGALPENWSVYQEMMVANSETFLFYNTNMRSLVVDKLQSCELVILNRASDATDKDEIHKVIRGVTRRSDIAYEYADGHVEYDEIEDPLPFDVEAEVVEVADRDYARWYRDLSEDMAKYSGKVMKFKGQVVASDPEDKHLFVFGRKIMVCCENDIAMRGLLCRDTTGSYKAKRGEWLVVTASVSIENHKIYGSEGPVLNMVDFEKADAPENEVATFY